MRDVVTSAVGDMTLSNEWRGTATCMWVLCGKALI